MNALGFLRLIRVAPSMALAVAAVMCGFVSTAKLLAAAPETNARPDDQGFIRDWLVLAPIPNGENVSGPDALKKMFLADEGKLRPKAGDKAKIGDLELTWKPLDSASWSINFNSFVGQQTEDSTAYAVTYIVADEPVKDLRLKMGSDDQSRLYLNGRLVLENFRRRSLDKDQNVANDIALEKGVNTLVLKVVNEKIDWSGAVRLTDKNNNPLTNFKVCTAP